MQDDKFKSGHYESALQYTKDILKRSSSIEQIAEVSMICKDDYKEKTNGKIDKISEKMIKS